MNKDLFERYLTERYEDQIAWYGKKATRNQTTYRWIQWPLIVLAALTPVLVQLDSLELVLGSSAIKLATLTSIVVAILTTALKTFNYQENWLNYRSTCEALRREKYYYEAGVDEYRESSGPEALFVERVEALMSSENTLWRSVHRPEKKTESQKT